MKVKGLEVWHVSGLWDLILNISLLPTLLCRLQLLLHMRQYPASSRIHKRAHHEVPNPSSPTLAPFPTNAFSPSSHHLSTNRPWLG